MFCPQCKSEFRKEFTRCRRCDIDLIEAPPSEPIVEYFRPTVVFTTSNLHEASLVKSLLEGNNIDVVMLDSKLPSLNLFYTNALGGIKLAVSESDFDEAKSILAEYRSKEGLDPSFGSATPFE